MALRYTILLAVALAAVAIVECTETVSTNEADQHKQQDAVSIKPPTNQAKKHKQQTSKQSSKPAQAAGCNTNQTIVLATWANATKCFSKLIKGVPDENIVSCEKADDLFGFKEPLLDALRCEFNKPEMKNNTAKNINAVLAMMNTTVTEYKDIVKSDTFSSCVNGAKQELINCVKSILHDKKTTVSKLGNFTVDKNILGLNFTSATGKGELEHIKPCFQDVWKGNDTCNSVLKFTDAMYAIAEKNAASIPISSIAIMIGAFFIALYVLN